MSFESRQDTVEEAGAEAVFPVAGNAAPSAPLNTTTSSGSSKLRKVWQAPMTNSSARITKVRPKRIMPPRV